MTFFRSFLRKVAILLLVALGAAVQFQAMRDIAAGSDQAGASLGELKRIEAINEERVRQALRGR